MTEDMQRDAWGSVDVLIAVWNAAGTIERAVRSALSEPEVHQVIVVDDGSTDDTAARVSGLTAASPGRVVLCRLDRNMGPSHARNVGLAQSRASWIAILDGDDYFRAGRFAALMSVADDADFVADDPVQLLEGKRDDADLALPRLIGESGVVALDFSQFVTGNISKRNMHRKEYGFLKPMMRRAFLDRHQLRYDEGLRLGEDFALYARALANGGVFKIVPSPTYVSVVRQNSLSGNHTKHDLERLRDSDIELARMPSLGSQEREIVLKHLESIDSRIQWLNVIDAVKKRDIPSFCRAFLVRWETSAFLARKLFEQFILRTRRALGS